MFDPITFLPQTAQKYIFISSDLNVGSLRVLNFTFVSKSTSLLYIADFNVFKEARVTYYDKMYELPSNLLINLIP